MASLLQQIGNVFTGSRGIVEPSPVPPFAVTPSPVNCTNSTELFATAPHWEPPQVTGLALPRFMRTFDPARTLGSNEERGFGVLGGAVFGVLMGFTTGVVCAAAGHIVFGTTTLLFLIPTGMPIGAAISGVVDHVGSTRSHARYLLWKDRAQWADQFYNGDKVRAALTEGDIAKAIPYLDQMAGALRWQGQGKTKAAADIYFRRADALLHSGRPDLAIGVLGYALDHCAAAVTNRAAPMALWAMGLLRQGDMAGAAKVLELQSKESGIDSAARGLMRRLAKLGAQLGQEPVTPVLAETPPVMSPRLGDLVRQTMDARLIGLDDRFHQLLGETMREAEATDDPRLVSAVRAQLLISARPLASGITIGANGNGLPALWRKQLRTYQERIAALAEMDLKSFLFTSISPEEIATTYLESARRYLWLDMPAQASDQMEAGVKLLTQLRTEIEGQAPEQLAKRRMMATQVGTLRYQQAVWDLVSLDYATASIHAAAAQEAFEMAGLTDKTGQADRLRQIAQSRIGVSDDAAALQVLNTALADELMELATQYGKAGRSDAALQAWYAAWEARRSAGDVAGAQTIAAYIRQVVASIAPRDESLVTSTADLTDAPATAEPADVATAAAKLTTPE